VRADKKEKKTGSAEKQATNAQQLIA